VTPLATLVDHAEIRESERALLRAIIATGSVSGSVADIAEAAGISRRMIFRALAEMERAGVIIRSSRPGRFGSVLVTFNGDAASKLARMCHRLGRSEEAPPGAEYTRPIDPRRAAEDRAHMIQTRARWSIYRRGEG